MLLYLDDAEGEMILELVKLKHRRAIEVGNARVVEECENVIGQLEEELQDVV